MDRLLDRGFTNLTLVDVSSVALQQTRARLGERARRVRWLEGDVLTMDLPPADLWHDRAVFHFQTSPEDQETYLRQLSAALRPGGHVLLATFAADGPQRCSGLDVARYDAEGLARRLGPDFDLLRSSVHTHPTPMNTEQRFQYALFRRRP